MGTNMLRATKIEAEYQILALELQCSNKNVSKF